MQGETLSIEKIAALYTSRDFAISECSLAARRAIERAERFVTLMASHVQAWKHLWRRFDVHLRPAASVGFKLNAPMLLRLNMFHLLPAASHNSIGLDIGVPARGWTGEAYQGHIFWDELFIFPTINFRMPEITRSLLMYRYRRLGEARAAARHAGFAGAMFPWQSGSDGQEETQEMNLPRIRSVGSRITPTCSATSVVLSRVMYGSISKSRTITSFCISMARNWSSR